MRESNYKVPLRTKRFFEILKKERLNIHRWDAQFVHEHRHEHFEMGYVLHGTATHDIDGNVYTLKKGDLFLVDKGVYHRYYDGNRFELINLCFYPEAIDRSFFSVRSLNNMASSSFFHFAPDISQNYTKVLLHDTDGRLLSVLEDLAWEMEQKGNGYRAVVRGHLVQLLVYFLREAGQQEAKNLSPTLGVILRNLHDRYMENVSVLDLCDDHYYTLNYLGKKFKEEMGVPFKTYLQNYRLQKAASLLTTTDYSVDEIASAVGYQNTPFFYKLFRQRYGTTPLHYRRSVRTYQDELI
ncbi:MAG: AraC family transcriptional regulator [Clostridia bacterium]|nr:AraC family transcriptional regulator [Clostridia bacterium]